MKMYQILNVSRVDNANFILPDTFIFKNLEDALENIENREKYFKLNGEKGTYRGIINSLIEIKRIYEKDNIIEKEHTDFYIYELEVF